jgi:hypothetical protein
MNTVIFGESLQQIETLFWGFFSLNVAASACPAGNLEEIPLCTLWPAAKTGQKANNNKGLRAYSYLLGNIRPAALVAV